MAGSIIQHTSPVPHVRIYGTSSTDDVAEVRYNYGQIRVELNGMVQNYGPSSVQEVRFYGYSGDDSFTNLTSITSIAWGYDGDDTLNGGWVDDSLYGNDGLDRLDGNGGDDYLDGGADRDSIYGGYNDDYMVGREGNDFMDGENGHDSLWGSEGNDFLRGQSGDDYLVGGDGNDFVYAHDGDDTVFGSDGNDFLDGGDGNDRLNADSGRDTLYGGDDHDTLDGGSGNDYMSGSYGNDYIIGRLGNDTLYGSWGDDTLYGSEGDDTLSGSSGADYIVAGDGHDSVNGGSGNDSSWGGTGNDTLDGWSGRDMIIAWSGNDSLDGGSGNDSLYAGSGDDQLNGSSGNDYLSGESGRDALLGWSGNDSVYGGSGADRFLKMDDAAANDSESEFKDDGSIDVIIDFDDSNARNLTLNGQAVTAQAGTWSESDVLRVDNAFAIMVQRTGNNVLLERKNGARITFERVGNIVDGMGNVTGFGGWNENNGRIAIAQPRFSNDNSLHRVVYHEIAHNWDDENDDWGDFLALSGWRRNNWINQWLFPKEDDELDSGDGEWWYDDTSGFARSYGTWNPREDFATSFAYYFMDYEPGRTWDFSVIGSITSKQNFMRNFLNSI